MLIFVAEFKEVYFILGAVIYIFILSIISIGFCSVIHEYGHARQAQKLGDTALVTIHNGLLKNRYLTYKRVLIFFSNDKRIRSKTYVKTDFTVYTDEQIQQISRAGLVNSCKCAVVMLIFAISGFLFYIEIGIELVLIWVICMFLFTTDAKKTCKKNQFNDFAIIKNPAAFREYMQHTTKDTYEEINKIINDIMKD